MVEEMFACLLRERIEPKNPLTVEPRALHHAVRLEFVRRDYGTTRRTLVGNDAHC